MKHRRKIHTQETESTMRGKYTNKITKSQKGNKDYIEKKKNYWGNVEEHWNDF